MNRRLGQGAWRTPLATLVAAPWLIWSVVRALGVESGDTFVSAMAVTPYVALTAPLPVLVALLLRRWAVACIATIALTLLVVAVLPRALPNDSPPGTDGGRRLVIMSINLDDGRADVTEIMRLVRRHRVDVLSLQEFKAGASERLEGAGARALFPHRVVHPRSRGGGSALLARRDIPLKAMGDERGATQAAARTTSLSTTPLAFAVVHPPHPTSDLEAAVWEATLRALPPAGGDGPLQILAGDFNATLDHRELRRVLERGYRDAADAVGRGLDPTWPVGYKQPPITIDHVMVDERIDVREFSTHEVGGTDHRAVITQVVLPQQAGTRASRREAASPARPRPPAPR